MWKKWLIKWTSGCQLVAQIVESDPWNLISNAQARGVYTDGIISIEVYPEART